MKTGEFQKLNSRKLPRVMIAAGSSGSGKTTMMMGLLDLFTKRGERIAAYKCGPDYIDPMFHRKVLGVPSENLDSFFMREGALISVLNRCPGEMALIEGVMGIYDGMSMDNTLASCYEVAKISRTPIVLLVDAKGVGRTVISVVKGLLSDDAERLIKGIILNRVTSKTFEMLKEPMEKALLDAGYDAKLLGYLPTMKDISIESRHLGLKLPHEIEDIKEKLALLSEQIGSSVDIDMLVEIAEEAKEISLRDDNAKEFAYADTGYDLGSHVNGQDGGLNCDSFKLAVARDEAFCFYYEDNLRLFNEMGVETVTFSPIHDEKLPEGVDGLLIGGGYPENYLKELSENKSMLGSVRKAIDGGMPYLAECGGFMYLHKGIESVDGDIFPMVGAIDASVSYKGKLVRFGYVEINASKQDCSNAEIDCESQNEVADGMRLSLYLNGMKGHEFHYYDSTDNGECCVAKKPMKDICWDCMHSDERSLAGFPHLYYRSCPEFAKGFVDAMKKYKGK